MLSCQEKKIEMEKSKLTLLELTKLIAESLRESFPDRYWIVAEINEIRESVNGHCYLELIQKDTDRDRIIARSKATIWAYTWRMLKPYFEASTSQSLSQGLTILIEVSVEFHELYGISLNVKDIDPVYTLGDLEKKRAETLKKLEKEGIINMNRSMPFPSLPSRIAIISSPVAAGYEDFIHQIKNNQHRYSFEITLFSALMQGDNAIRSVTEALDAVFEKEEMFDVVVILRGGGSTADLNCFDSYEIAAHIAQFPLPVITGIGHERDHNIAGIVANTDLKTPTAVAEFLLGKYQELDVIIGKLSGRLATRVSHILEQNRQMIRTAIKDIPQIINNNIKQKYRHLSSKGSLITRSAAGFIQKNKHKLESKHSYFGFNIKNYLHGLKNSGHEIKTRTLPEKVNIAIKNRSDKLHLFKTTLKLVDPENILKKGYAVVIKNGRIVKNAQCIDFEDLIETKLYDGSIKSKVLEVNIRIKDK